MKKNMNDIEMKIYKMLGVKIFRKFVFLLRDFILLPIDFLLGKEEGSIKERRKKFYFQ